MGLSGNFAALQKLQANLIRTKVVPLNVARAVTPAVNASIQGTFGSKTNLYGDAWEPISPRTIARGSKSAGIRTGALMGSIVARPEGAKIRVPLGQYYGKYAIAKRRSPYPKTTLPPAWEPFLKSESERAFREVFSG